MGCTFNNLHVRTGDLTRVRDAAIRQELGPFAVAKSGEGWTTLCPEEMSLGGGPVAKRLAQDLDTVVLFFSCYDSDVFSYERYDGGERVDAYVSNPGEVDMDADYDAAPRGGDHEKLQKLCLPGTSLDVLERLLRQRRVQNLSDQELKCRQIAERHQWLEAAKKRYEEMKDKVPGLTLESVLESAKQNFIPSVDEEAVCREDLAKKLGEYLGIDASASTMDYAATEEPWLSRSTVAWERING